MAKKNKKRVLGRHKFWFAIGRFISRIFICPKYHFRPKYVKLDKKQNYIIMSNHQANLDPAFLVACFRKPLYFVSSEHIFHKGFLSKIVSHVAAPIPKKKSALDINCILEMKQTAEEGGSIAIFLEGNRTWTNSQFPLNKSCVKLVRSLNIPLVLFNLKGGFGVDPRWANKKRKGPFTGVARHVLSVEQMNDMSDDELFEAIKYSLDVHDGDNGELYKSKTRAEYLERMMFICDCCHKKNTLVSNGNFIKCNECGNEYEYSESLKLRNTKDDNEKTLFDYYSFQAKEVIKDTITPNEVIFKDSNIGLYETLQKGKKLLALGEITLTDKSVTVGNVSIDTSTIISISLISGDKMTIDTKDKSYLFIGEGRINFMKYVFYIEKLDSNLFEKEDYYAINVFNA